MCTKAPINWYTTTVNNHILVHHTLKQNKNQIGYTCIENRRFVLITDKKKTESWRIVVLFLLFWCVEKFTTISTYFDKRDFKVWITLLGSPTFVYRTISVENQTKTTRRIKITEYVKNARLRRYNEHHHANSVSELNLVTKSVATKHVQNYTCALGPSAYFIASKLS